MRRRQRRVAPATRLLDGMPAGKKCTKPPPAAHRYRVKTFRPGDNPMRLTLRTLLAYLDDTLPPDQAREIGQKVAESQVAQDLIERIKKVTRRRGLSTPPAAGPDRVDANTVAEYLDNDLTGDK